MIKISQNNIEQTWDCIAQSFDKTRKMPWTACVQFIRKLNSNSIIGDFGCGNGRHTLPCAKHCKRVIALDLSSNLLNIVKDKTYLQHYQNVSVIHASLTNLPIRDNYFDAIIAIASIHNIPYKKNRVASLREIFRVLKKDGKALITVWSKNQEKFQDFKKIQKKKTIESDQYIYWNQDNLHIPRYYHLYDKEELFQDITHAGFNNIHIDELSIANKKNTDNYFAYVVK
jgi:ubiquinone/menaquinone biosynthesis C-methylase UbiE